MENQNSSLIARDDTMLGICQGIGEDFGFNPLYLRAALSVALFWNPAAVFAVYAALGVLVLFSRLVFPNPRLAPAVAAAAAPAAAEPDAGRQQPLPLAA